MRFILPWIYALLNLFVVFRDNAAFTFHYNVQSASFRRPQTGLSSRLNFERFSKQHNRIGFMSDPDASAEVDPTPKDLDNPTSQSSLTTIPVVNYKGTKMDIFSRLLKDRIILVGKEINDDVANSVVGQLLYLANEDPHKDINLYINCAGGSVSSAMAIFDVMRYVSCPVSTVCIGTASAMGAFLLGAGTPGKRKALPNARIMLHQPLGGARGQAADIEIQAKEILFVRSQINSYLAEFTNQSIERIEEDCDRDFYLTSQQALDYGLIDEVIQTKSSRIQIPTKL